ncbi:histidine kinase dimerization/phospho-acceptor domain-containing protein [Prauserella cavernicola]|uniref:histidine kinase n=1 Tax=Prauserella cavernicola TaxID=2800127 RepID=A0A934QVZ0_9PSEU|nr:histidine kinase dimerization/phospho-acceptor domain-containing protein [Prauserella cavernicola]MBK1787575.1 PAS domain-containing protein [Prauserella cavernicola]
MRSPDTPSGEGVALADEVRRRFGVLPNIFRPVPGLDDPVAGLWAFARSAYLDNPLPSLFKERLVVHLSRFCEVRYCVLRHTCFLLGHGHPAGDPRSPADSVGSVLRLLRRPVPDPVALGESLDRLEAVRSPVVPGIGTELEGDLFDACTVLFLDGHESGRARTAASAALGPRGRDQVMTLLAFVRAAHHWTELHPDLEREPDVAAVLAEHAELARVLCDRADALAVNPRVAYRHTADELRRTRTSLAVVEQRYRWLFASMDTGFSLVERGSSCEQDYRIVVVNPAQALLTGLTPMVGGPARDLLPGAGDELAVRLTRVAESGLPEQFEVELPASGRWLDVQVAAAAAEQGRTFVVAVRDVSERVRAAALQSRREQAQREFVANAAHEFRTPLTTMITAIDTLEGGAVDDPVSRGRFLGHLRREADRLARLSDSLLVLADVEAGPEPQWHKIRLGPILDEIAGELAPAAGVVVTVDAPAGIAAVTNRGLVEIVVANLAANAARHTDRGRITLSAAECDAGVLVEVRDTGEGLGISAEQAVRRFARGGARTADGFGLGLSIAQQAALALGAELGLADGPDGGVHARLLLPRLPHETTRVLLIDGDDAARESLAHALTEHGCAVLEAADGERGLALARENDLDLIVVAELLADGRGSDAIRLLRAAGDGGQRLLALDGSSAHTDALAAGADEVVARDDAPARLVELARTLADAERAVPDADSETGDGVAVGRAVVALGRHGATRVLHVSGDIDAVNAADWRRALIAMIEDSPSDVDGVVIDLSGVTLLSASGIRALAAANDHLRDVPLAIVATGLTRRMLAVIDVDGRLPLTGDLESALVSLPLRRR